MSRDAMPCSILIAALIGMMMAGAPAGALDPSVRDHDEARQATTSGKIRSLGEIRQRVGARVRGELIGIDPHLDARRYTFRYLREGSVVEVDVDAATGNILSIQGN